MDEEGNTLLQDGKSSGEILLRGLWIAQNYYNVLEKFNLLKFETVTKENLLKAKENLSKAIEIFKDCGADGWVDKYEKELATLS